MRRPPQLRILAAFLGALLLQLGAGLALAVDDTTPPQGTLTIDGGLGYTNDGILDLDVPATDDVGVATVHIGLLGGALTEYPYAPRIEHSIGDISLLAQQQLTLYVEWRDAAGNASSTQQTFWLDTAAPDLQTFQETTGIGPAGTVTFQVGAYEEASGVAAVQLSTNGGSSWGAEIPMPDGQLVVWNPRDPAVGGLATALGTLTVHARVRDGTGQWSNVMATQIGVAVALEVGVSANPTTGQPLTLSADWAGSVALPSGAMCLWEFMWGDDASIFLAERNETFGYVMTQGPASAGFCDHWTFTLPWTPVRQYLVNFRVMTSDWDILADAMIGSSPQDPSFSSVVGSTSRSMTQSSLPMFYVLPDAYELEVGEPAVYRAFALGGATIKSTDTWSIQYVNTPERHPGSSVLTFYPKTTGYITVCLGRDYSAGRQLGACFDPAVKPASGSGGGGGGSGGGGGGTATQAPPPAATTGPTASSEASLPPGTPAATEAAQSPAPATPGAVAAGDPSRGPTGTLPEVIVPTTSSTPWAVLGLFLVLVMAAGAMASERVRSRALSGIRRVVARR